MASFSPFCATGGLSCSRAISAMHNRSTILSAMPAGLPRRLAAALGVVAILVFVASYQAQQAVDQASRQATLMDMRSSRFAGFELVPLRSVAAYAGPAVEMEAARLPLSVYNGQILGWETCYKLNYTPCKNGCGPCRSINGRQSCKARNACRDRCEDKAKEACKFVPR